METEIARQAYSQKLFGLSVTLLDDHKGISEKAWERLQSLFPEQTEIGPKCFKDLISCVCIKDGRVFFKKVRK